jgi:hypothetical protein
MADGYFDTVLCIANPKPCALFYKGVIPSLASPDMVSFINEGLKIDDESARKRLTQMYNSFLPDKLLKKRDFETDLARVSVAILGVVVRDLRHKTERAASETQEDTEVVRVISAFLHKYRLLNIQLDVPKEMISNDCDAASEFCVTLARGNLIKAEAVSWERIFELRRDKTAKEKLRRFRLFADANYRGKSRAYVQDDISRRVDEYESIVKQWGFETAEGALNILASSKTLAGTGAGDSLRLGWGSSDGRFSGSRGVAIELGRIGIYLGKQRFSLRKMLKENPVFYLSCAKKQLGEDDAS